MASGLLEGQGAVDLGITVVAAGPWIRQKCTASLSGQGHASYALYGSQGGRRFSPYLPQEVVPEVEQAVANGRQLCRSSCGRLASVT